MQVGANIQSVHGTGRALDISITSPGSAEATTAMWYVINLMVAQYCDLNLQRIVFNGRVWNADDGVLVGPSGMSLLASSNKHNDHLHLEISPASCENLTYEQVLTIMNPVISFPGIKEIAPPSVEADPSVIPQITQVAPAAQASLLVTDTSGKWTDETLKDICGMSAYEDGRAITRVICGGRGGYAIDTFTGSVCAAGLAVEYGDVGTEVIDFLPYGSGYYAITNRGYSIENFGPDTATTRPSCARVSAPYAALYSPRPGALIAVGEGGGGLPALCEFAAPNIAGSTASGPCC
jgi:hypothetical protein